MKWQPFSTDGTLSISQKKQATLQELQIQIVRRETDMLTEIGSVEKLGGHLDLKLMLVMHSSH